MAKDAVFTMKPELRAEFMAEAEAARQPGSVERGSRTGVRRTACRCGERGVRALWTRKRSRIPPTCGITPQPITRGQETGYSRIDPARKLSLGVRDQKEECWTPELCTKTLIWKLPTDCGSESGVVTQRLALIIIVRYFCLKIICNFCKKHLYCGQAPFFRWCIRKSRKR